MSVIFGSLLLILVAVVTFGLGLAQGSNLLLVVSIAASLVAAVAIVLAARRAAAAREDVGPMGATGLDDGERIVEERATPPSTDRPREPGHLRTEGTVYGRDSGTRAAPDTGTDVLVSDDPERASIPTQSGGSRHVELDIEPDVDDDPPDEPAAQLVTPGDAARVARMSAEVLVIDGRPRYHQAGCVHLLGRDSEPLPVSEAIELGFSPCSLCEPDSALLAEARG